MSAHVLLSRRQKMMATSMVMALLTGAAATGWKGVQGLLVMSALPFASVVLLRAHAVWYYLTRRRARVPPSAAATRRQPHDPFLPTYSILVPLYREGRVVGALIRALQRLDYPASRLEILLITEEHDHETRMALQHAGLAPNMRIVIVPQGKPRTKPRALNYALTFARGDYVAVYDAEDSPEPGQLKMAVRAFRTRPGRIGCVQARLDIYTEPKNFLIRQFTLEYMVLFHVLLPAYQKLAIPLPLGGTSNHFPRAVLQGAGGWDPFNVTEDADLGMRLARAGYGVAMIGSTTWEEAPVRLSQWFGQRTRWIKGWMQTYLVHMRKPLALLRDMGPWGFCGFQLVFAGMLFSAILHPITLLALGFEWASGRMLHEGPEIVSRAVSLFCLVNVAAAYVCAALTGLAAAIRRRRYHLAISALFVPVYWLLISAAAYVALLELLRRPHHWRKTRHTGAGRERIDSSGRIRPGAG